jgi:hypothetical protein
MVPDQPLTHGDHRRNRPRIETQIHRRKKAKAFSALEPEWEQINQGPPAHLRMPSNCMAPTPPNEKTKHPPESPSPQRNDGSPRVK